jgi:aminoglycoside 6'-N-acetyltransferase
VLRFRSIVRSDFPLLSHWLQQPHIAYWWANDPSHEALERDYGGSVDGTQPCDVWIALRTHGAQSKPIGLALRYRWDAYPDYINELTPIMPVPPQAWSIDYLVGEQSLTGQGWGTQMIHALTQSIWHDHAQSASVIVPVNADNRYSWRALERAGYMRVASGPLVPDNPVHGMAHYVYRIDRPASANTP